MVTKLLMLKNVIANSILFFCVLCLASCATFSSQQQLTKLQIGMSSAIYLPRTLSSQRTVAIDIQNASTEPGSFLVKPLQTAIGSKNYRVLNDPGLAYFFLQVHLLQLGLVSSAQIETLLENGYGSPVAFTQNSNTNGAETLVNAIIVDIQISQRIANIDGQQKNPQLTQNSLEDILSSSSTHWNRYQTRMIVQLPGDQPFDKVQNELTQSMAHAIANFFP